MTETEKAYLAGIIDGEGTVTLSKKHKSQYPSPQISISNTNLDLLEYIRSITGCGCICSKKTYKSNHSQSWHWQVNSVSDSLKNLRSISPFLRVKKPQANLILKYYKKLTPRNGRYTSEMLKCKKQLVACIRDLNAGKNVSSIIRQAPSNFDG